MEVIQKLKVEEPAIYTREYQANHGIIEFDIRAVTETEMHVIVNRLKEIMNPEEPKNEKIPDLFRRSNLFKRFR